MATDTRSLRKGLGLGLEPNRADGLNDWFTDIRNRSVEDAYIQEQDRVNRRHAGMGDFTRGLKMSGEGLGEAANGVNAIRLALMGDKEGAAQAARDAQVYAERAQAAAPRVNNYKDIEGVGDAVDFAQGALGQMAGSIAAIVAGSVVGGVGGGATALAAKTLGKKLIQNQIKRELKKQAKKSAVSTGMKAGAYTTGAAMEGGGAGSELLGYEARGEQAPFSDVFGRELTMKERAGLALGAGIAGGALEALPVIHAARRWGIGDKVEEAIKQGFASRVGRQALEEGTTEAMQSVIQRSATAVADENKEVLGEEGWNEIINSGLIGAIGGGGFGVVTPPIRSLKDGKDKAQKLLEDRRKKNLPAVQEGEMGPPQPPRPDLELPPGFERVQPTKEMQDFLDSLDGVKIDAHRTFYDEEGNAVEQTGLGGQAGELEGLLRDRESGYTEGNIEPTYIFQGRPKYGSRGEVIFQAPFVEDSADLKKRLDKLGEGHKVKNYAEYAQEQANVKYGTDPAAKREYIRSTAQQVSDSRSTRKWDGEQDPQEYLKQFSIIQGPDKAAREPGDLSFTPEELSRPFGQYKPPMQGRNIPFPELSSLQMNVVKAEGRKLYGASWEQLSSEQRDEARLSALRQIPWEGLTPEQQAAENKKIKKEGRTQETRRQIIRSMNKDTFNRGLNQDVDIKTQDGRVLNAMSLTMAMQEKMNAAKDVMSNASFTQKVGAWFTSGLVSLQEAGVNVDFNSIPDSTVLYKLGDKTYTWGQVQQEDINRSNNDPGTTGTSRRIEGLRKKIHEITRDDKNNVRLIDRGDGKPPKRVLTRRGARQIQWYVEQAARTAKIRELMDDGYTFEEAKQRVEAGSVDKLVAEGYSRQEAEEMAADAVNVTNDDLFDPKTNQGKDVDLLERRLNNMIQKNRADRDEIGRDTRMDEVEQADGKEAGVLEGEKKRPIYRDERGYPTGVVTDEVVEKNISEADPDEKRVNDVIRKRMNKLREAAKKLKKTPVIKVGNNRYFQKVEGWEEIYQALVEAMPRQKLNPNHIFLPEGAKPNENSVTTRRLAQELKKAHRRYEAILSPDKILPKYKLEKAEREKIDKAIANIRDEARAAETGQKLLREDSVEAKKELDNESPGELAEENGTWDEEPPVVGGPGASPVDPVEILAREMYADRIMKVVRQYERLYANVVQKEAEMVAELADAMGLDLKPEMPEPHLFGAYLKAMSKDPESWAMLDSFLRGEAKGMLVGDTEKTFQWLILNPKVTDTKERFGVIFHELGHSAFRNKFESLSDQAQDALYNDFEAWLEKHKHLPINQIMASKRGLFTRVVTHRDVMPKTLEEVSPQMQEYVASFEEWFADQTEMYFTTEPGPNDIVGKFFKEIADFIKSLFSLAKERNLTTAPSVKAFYDEMFLNTNNGFKADPAKVAEMKDFKSDLWTNLMANSEQPSSQPRQDYENLIRGIAEQNNLNIDDETVAKINRHAKAAFRGDNVNINDVANFLLRVISTATDPLQGMNNAAMRSAFAHLLNKQERKIVAQAFSTRFMQNRLRRMLLEDNNRAGADEILQDPEALIAYGYQYWRDGKLDLGPKAGTKFKQLSNRMAKVLGVVRESERAEAIFEKLADDAVLVRKELGNRNQSFAIPAQKVGNTVQRLTAVSRQVADKIAPTIRRPVYNAFVRMEKTKNPYLRQLALSMYAPSDVQGNQVSMLEAKRIKIAEYHRRIDSIFNPFKKKFLNDMGNLDKKAYGQFKTDVATAMATGKFSQDPDVRAAQEQLKTLLQEVREYVSKAGVDIGKQGTDVEAGYWPWVYDTAALAHNPEPFVDLLVETMTDEFALSYIKEIRAGKKTLIPKDKKRTTKPTPEEKRRVAERVLQSILVSEGFGEGVLNFEKDAHTPYMPQHDTRILSFMSKNQEKLAPYLEKDLDRILISYLDQSAKRAEHARRFGDDGKGLDAILQKARSVGATDEDIKTAVQFSQALMGTIGGDVNPKLRAGMSYTMAYENLRLLSMVTLSSLVDPMGILVRTGSVQDSLVAFRAAMKEMATFIPRAAGDDVRGKHDARLMADTLGIIEDTMAKEALSYEYGGAFMSPWARKMNDKWFDVVGLSSFTRMTRVMATAAGQNFIKRHAAGLDPKNSTRYLDELGIQASDVKLDNNGNLKFLSDDERLTADEAELARDDRMRTAMFRFVDESILRPDAAQRPIWASDPHFMLVFHLKAFMYSFHERIVRRAWAEMVDNGNYTPMAGLALYVPGMIAADILRDAIRDPGDDFDDDRKDNWGVGDWIQHGILRAQILTPAVTMAHDAYKDAAEFGKFPGLSIAGPAAEHAVGLLSLEGGAANQAWEAIPAQNLLRPIWESITDDGGGTYEEQWDRHVKQIDQLNKGFDEVEGWIGLR